MSQTEMRMIKWRGALYLRREDVVEYFLKCSEGEETNTRHRFVEAASHLAVLQMRDED
jgi:hypothetical protein